MDYAALSAILNKIEHRSTNPSDYFECLESLDALEFHILDRIDRNETSPEMLNLRERATQVHARFSTIAQANIDTLIHEICSKQIDHATLKQRFTHYANAVSNNQLEDKPDYDAFDDFLNHLLQIAYKPSETRLRTEDMLYLQPTPGRIILDMINTLPFTESDRFYDIGSGLGHVPILVALLTGISAVGIEYEETYVHYSHCAAQKLGLKQVEFRNMDAQEADFSDGTIFFMYTPFKGSILRNVLNRLQTLSRERPITLCSYGPCTATIAQETWLSPQYTRHGIYRLAIFKSH